MSHPVVLFDLDGTVIDSTALIRESHRHAVSTVLGQDLPDEVLVANVGVPLLQQMKAFDPDRAEELLAVYQEWNHRMTPELLAEYEGMPELLEDLRAAGRRLGIVTSKSGPVVELAWDVLPLSHHFEVVVSSETTDRHKPHPEPVHRALAEHGVGPHEAVMVGDSPFDLRAGKAAGADTIGVTWGFFGREALAAEDPGIVVDTVDELRSALGLG
ncbi:MAG: HAD family hydrolase [Miltoncostaeaceae bacterium]